MSPKKTAGPGTTPAAVERRDTVRHDVTLLTDEDLRLFDERTHDHLYDKLGAHPLAAESGAGTYFAVCSFTMVPRFHYPVGVPLGGFWREVLNGDALEYGGGGIGNLGGVTAAPDPRHGRPYSLDPTLPPLAAVFFKSEGGNP